jgi:hypothetical protein
MPCPWQGRGCWWWQGQDKRLAGLWEGKVFVFLFFFSFLFVKVIQSDEVDPVFV